MQGMWGVCLPSPPLPILLPTNDDTNSLGHTGALFTPPLCTTILADVPSCSNCTTQPWTLLTPTGNHPAHQTHSQQHKLNPILYDSNANANSLLATPAHTATVPCCLPLPSHATQHGHSWPRDICLAYIVTWWRAAGHSNEPWGFLLIWRPWVVWTKYGGSFVCTKGPGYGRRACEGIWPGEHSVMDVGCTNAINGTYER